MPGRTVLHAPACPACPGLRVAVRQSSDKDDDDLGSALVASTKPRTMANRQPSRWPPAPTSKKRLSASSAVWTRCRGCRVPTGA